MFNCCTTLEESKMNTIKGLLDKSDYEIYDDFLNFQVDGYWLDEKLDEIYPRKSIKGTVPTLLFLMAVDKESEIVWNRILPNQGEKTICPILMCPDDADFSCTLIVAEIENTGKTIIWNKLGMDNTDEVEPEKIGSTVDWLDKVDSLEFNISEYKNMLNRFKEHFEYKKLKWKEKSRKLLEEDKNERSTTPRSKPADSEKRIKSTLNNLWSRLTGK